MITQAGGKLTRKEVLDAEIDRLAEALRSYLEAIRELVRARGLLDAVNKTEISSAVIDGMVNQLQGRVQEATKRVADLEAERDDEIQQLRMVLRLRGELPEGA
jgi:predicted  nucleic acid-binding Zn-ribbon protein